MVEVGRRSCVCDGIVGWLIRGRGEKEDNDGRSGVCVNDVEKLLLKSRVSGGIC